jgi:hypothetical protein
MEKVVKKTAERGDFWDVGDETPAPTRAPQTTLV